MSRTTEEHEPHPPSQELEYEVSDDTHVRKWVELFQRKTSARKELTKSVTLSMLTGRRWKMTQKDTHQETGSIVGTGQARAEPSVSNSSAESCVMIRRDRLRTASG